jgi:hypothetical protein
MESESWRYLLDSPEAAAMSNVARNACALPTASDCSQIPVLLLNGLLTLARLRHLPPDGIQ